MKKEKDKEFDDLFNSKLGDPPHTDTSYFEDDWGALEEMLDKTGKRRGLVLWLPILAGAAAILLLLGWLYFKPSITNDQQVAVNHPQNNTNTGKNDVSHATAGKTGELTSTAPAKTHQTAAPGVVVRPPVGIGNRLANNRLVAVSNKPVNTLVKNGEDENTAPAIPGSVYRTPESINKPSFMLAAMSYNGELSIPADDATKELTKVEKKDIGSHYRLPAFDKDNEDDDKQLTKLGFVKHPQLALTVLGAPELNGVGSFSDAKSGTNIGMLFSAGLFNKLTVSTGATYATMPYNTDIANYHTSYTFKTDPSLIEADCRVLDIPLNFDYQLYNKHQNKFSIGTGLSSYIMLHESYDYYYDDPNAKGPKTFLVPTDGKYFFSIVNLQATYTRQINSKFGLSIEPYMKLPLSNIGYSQSRLQTAGVAVGVSWNINSLIKP